MTLNFTPELILGIIGAAVAMTVYFRLREHANNMEQVIDEVYENLRNIAESHNKLAQFISDNLIEEYEDEDNKPH